MAVHPGRLRLLAVSRRRHRAQSFVTEADYIKVHELAETESFAFWDYGIELSRRFRALKVWLTLKYYGAARLMEAIRDDIAMAHYMAERG